MPLTDQPSERMREAYRAASPEVLVWLSTMTVAEPVASGVALGDSAPSEAAGGEDESEPSTAGDSVVPVSPVSPVSPVWVVAVADAEEAG
ncbi:MAG: hypothetical protein ACTHMW_06855, partial [Actinomycetes bacterium]